MLIGHGDDTYRYPGRIRVDFSSNVRSDAPLELLQAFLRGRLDSVGHYPEPAAESLTAHLAEQSAIKAENVLVTNGAVAAIYLVAQAFRGKHSQVFIPTFVEYEDAARVNDHSLEFLPWNDFSSAVFARDGLAWLCNPNNPTGAVLAREELLGIVDRNSQTIFVVDLAYAAFARSEPLRPKDAQVRLNLLLVHSLTKEYAIPGLRLGFITGSVEALSCIRKVNAPWSVNALALEVGGFILSNRGRLALPLESYLAEADDFRKKLGAVPGLAVSCSATGFFLLELSKGNARQLKTDLIKRHGLLIRDASNFRGLGTSHFRVNTQGLEKNALLVEALRAWMHS